MSLRVVPLNPKPLSPNFWDRGSQAPGSGIKLRGLLSVSAFSRRSGISRVAYVVRDSGLGLGLWDFQGFGVVRVSRAFRD